MNPNIPSIDQLVELALPAPVSYAPQTWGWWTLLGLLVATLLVWAARRYWVWRRDRYRREALVRLNQLHASNELSALRELPELLKRVALSIPATHASPVGASLLAMRALYSKTMLTDRTPSRAGSLPQENPGALTGEDWQAFLAKHSPTPLPADFSQQLATLAYAPDATLLALPTEQRQQVFETCRTWVEQHHVAV
ncbi:MULTISPECIES: DUF4381 domain-containing protein [unclassified Pseudomonas]|uniref:DUF4381 domain-containing protein n=1 Tax=unclassified Pseudomonas TaxID=196821 RepID=UPI000B813267|nr:MULTISPECIES: DUF4381 domain-containing protein [unclassified Pseudomonas]